MICPQAGLNILVCLTPIQISGSYGTTQLIPFDLKDDFPLLRAETYFTNPTLKLSSYGEKGSPYTKEQKLSDICDGIVFIKPVSEFNGMHLINIYDKEFIEKTNKRTKGSCKTAEDILRTVKEWHPILQYNTLQFYINYMNYSQNYNNIHMNYETTNCVSQ